MPQKMRKATYSGLENRNREQPAAPKTTPECFRKAESPSGNILTQWQNLDLPGENQRSDS